MDSSNAATAEELEYWTRLGMHRKSRARPDCDRADILSAWGAKPSKPEIVEFVDAPEVNTPGW